MARTSCNYTKREQIQGTHFWAIIYEESDEYDYQIILNRLPYYWTKFWYIKHEHDVYLEEDLDQYLVDHNGESPVWHVGDLKKVHYHIMGETSPCMLGRAAKKFGIPSNYVQKVNNVKKAVQYLIHLKQKNKYQYTKEEIITNDDKLESKLKMELESYEKAEIIFDAIQSGNYPTMTALAKYAIKEKVWDELRRGQHIYCQLLSDFQREKYENYKNLKEN